MSITMLRSRSTNILHDMLPRMLLHTTAITLNVKAFASSPTAFVGMNSIRCGDAADHCRGSQSVSGRRS